MGLASAAIASAVIGAGTSLYAANEQKKAQDEAARMAAEAARLEEERQRSIFEATKPQEEAAKISFGLDDDEEILPAYSEFITPITPNNTISSLGFGTLGGTV
jgi:hypothetical protein